MGSEMFAHVDRRASFQIDEVSCDTSLREHRKIAVGSFRAGTCEFTSPSLLKKNRCVFTQQIPEILDLIVTTSLDYCAGSELLDPQTVM